MKKKMTKFDTSLTYFAFIFPRHGPLKSDKPIFLSSNTHHGFFFSFKIKFNLIVNKIEQKLFF